MRTRGFLAWTLTIGRNQEDACHLQGGEQQRGQDMARLTSVTRCLEQQQDLVVVEMFEGIDMVNDLRREVAMARETRRGGDALGNATERS